MHMRPQSRGVIHSMSTIYRIVMLLHCNKCLQHYALVCQQAISLPLISHLNVKIGL
jgi:hypothetical protein